MVTAVWLMIESLPNSSLPLHHGNKPVAGMPLLSASQIIGCVYVCRSPSRSCSRIRCMREYRWRRRLRTHGSIPASRLATSLASRRAKHRGPGAWDYSDGLQLPACGAIVLSRADVEPIDATNTWGIKKRIARMAPSTETWSTLRYRAICLPSCSSNAT